MFLFSRSLPFITAIFGTLLCVGCLHSNQQAPASGYLTVDLAELTGFSFDRETGDLSDVPAKVRALDGKRIRACGVIFSPVTQNDRVVLIAKANWTLSRVPRVEQCVRIIMPSTGPRLQTSREEGCISGIFHVDVQRGDGGVTQLFRLDAESVQLE